MKKALLYLLLAGLVTILPLASTTPREKQQVNVSYDIQVDPHNTQAFEQALKNDIKVRQEDGDNWTWQTWEFVNGDHLGQYVVRSPHHAWSDLDTHLTMGPEFGKHFNDHVLPFADRVSSSISTTLPGLDHWKHAGTMPRMLELLQFNVRPDQMDNFMYVLHKFDEAVAQTNSPLQYTVYRTINGGNSYIINMVIPRNSWGEFAPQPFANPSHPLRTAYNRNGEYVPRPEQNRNHDIQAKYDPNRGGVAPQPMENRNHVEQAKYDPNRGGDAPQPMENRNHVEQAKYDPNRGGDAPQPMENRNHTVQTAYDTNRGGKAPLPMENDTHAIRTDANNWGEFTPLPDQNWNHVLKVAFGTDEAQRLVNMWGKAVESMDSHVLVYRPDLSLAR